MLLAWFGNMARVLLPGRSFYIWGGYANCGNYPPVLKAVGLYFSQAVIWVKEHPVLTRKDFMGNHEWAADTLEETRAQAQARIAELEAESRTLARDLRRHNGELRALAGRIVSNGTATDRVADLQDRIRAAEQRGTQVREELIALRRELLGEEDVARALAAFDPLWETLAPREQARVIRLLVQRVDYDGEKETVSVTFHPAGIKMLSREFAEVKA